MKKFTVFLLIIIIMISCSKNGPVEPGVTDPERLVEDFNNDEECVFGTVSTVYYDADITEILQGPGLGSPSLEGTLWEDPTYGNTWAVAVALREVNAVTNTRNISLKFLCDDGSSPSAISSEFIVTDEEESDIVGNISLARVAACYLETYGEEDDTLYTFVEVSIIYQIRIQEEYAGRNQIRIVQLGFDPDDIYLGKDFATVEPKWVNVIEDVFGNPQDDEGGGLGKIMPDIAYDPRSGDYPTHPFGKGDLYYVWTWYRSTFELAPAGPRVYCGHLIRINAFHSNLLPVSPVLIQSVIGQYEHAICHGFQPRMDIGSWGWPGYSSDWRVSVAYCGNDFTLFPHFAYFSAGEDMGTTQKADIRLEFFFVEPEEHTVAGFMPSIDVCNKDLDEAGEENLCALTWTQVKTNYGFLNDTTVSYIDTHFGYGSLEALNPANLMESFSSPSVCIYPYNGSTTNSFLSYLRSDNPNSLRWVPNAMVLNTDLNEEVLEDRLSFGVITPLSGEFYGDYDFGAQFSNWYGMSASCILDSGNYWVLWSSPSNEGAQFNLTSVYGIWGYPE
jgi:hypothetical protein